MSNPKLDNFLQKIISKAKLEDGNLVFYLSKDEITSKLLPECLASGQFEELANGRQWSFCVEEGQDLYFNKEDFAIVLENAMLIEQRCGNELSFVEEIVAANPFQVSGRRDLSIEQITHRARHSLSDVIKYNKRILGISEKINNYRINDHGTIRELSPFEKYYICACIISKMENPPQESNQEELITRDGYITYQSYVDTINNQKGCCVGKASALKVLLNLVGVNAITISANSEYESKITDKLLSQYYWSYMRTKHRSSIRELIQEEPSDFFEIVKYRKYIKQLISDHQICLVEINDPLYNVFGLLGSDPAKATNFDTMLMPSYPITAFLPLKNCFGTFFNFTSFFNLSQNPDLKKFIERANIEDTLPDSVKEDIEREYLDYFKDSYFSWVSEQLSQKGENISDLMTFKRKLYGCKSLDDFYDLFDEYSEMDTPFAKELCALEGGFFKDNMLSQVNDAIDARLSLQSIPIAKKPNGATLASLASVSDEIYNEYFAEEEKTEE